MGPKWARVGLILRTFRDPLRAHNCSYDNAPHAGESSIFKVLASKRVPTWVQDEFVSSSFCTLLATHFAHTTFLTKMHPMQARAPFSRLGPRKMGPERVPKWVKNELVLKSCCTLFASHLAQTTFLTNLTKTHPMQARAPFPRFGPLKINSLLDAFGHQKRSQNFDPNMARK